MSRSDAGVGDVVEFDGKEGENLSRSVDGDTEDFIGFSQLSLEDKGWISPPGSICCSSSGSDITSAEASLPDSLNDSAENKGELSQGSSSRNPTGHVHSTPLSQTDVEEISPFEVSESYSMEANVKSAGSVKLTDEATEHPKASDNSVAIPADSQNPSNENLNKFEGEHEQLSTNKVKNDAEHHEAPDPNINARSRVGRGTYEVFFFSPPFLLTFFNVLTPY